MKPEDRIVAFLYGSKSKVEYSTLDLVVLKIKSELFYGMSPLTDAEIRAVVSKWAAFNAPGLVLRSASYDVPDSPPPSSSDPPPSTSDVVDAVKKVIKSVNDGVTIGPKGANFNVGVSGATANLKSGEKALSFGLSWSGALKLNANSGPFYLSGTLSKDRWEIILSFPQDTYIPNSANLAQIFSEAERGLGKIAAATQGFTNVSDVSKVGALIKPHVGAVQKAVEAASGLAKASKKGGMSLGFKIGSPDALPGEQGIPSGVQGTIVWTYVF
ncbi:MAG: hypothetical protein ABI823_07240 [Bryobacteraceae bacterium]